MKTSIIIITKNQKAYLQKTIPVLKNQKFSGEYEIIVVDSGSTDGAVEYCKQQNVKLVQIPPDKFNYAHALNFGAKNAKGEFLIRLSGDCIPVGENWLQEFITGFIDDKVGGVFGKYTISGKKGYGYPDYWPASRFPKALTRYSEGPHFLMGIELYKFTYGKKIFEFAGGACAVRKSIWKNRPFNENLLAGEDAEYSWYLHLIGYDIIYNPEIKSLHEHKIVKLNIKEKNFFKFDKWNFMFKMNIWNYWFKRLLFSDPYKDFRYKNEK